MKKIFTLVFFVFILLTIAKEANATATLYLGTNIGGMEKIADNNSLNFYSGGLSNGIINFTYTNKFQLCIESQTGESKYYWQRPMHLEIVKIGYPIVDDKNGLIYITAGYLSCQRDQISEARGLMLGADIISIATDDLYFGLDFQYSLFGASYRRKYPSYLELPMYQLSIKMKVQYILMDNLGLVVNFHWLHFNANDGLIVEEVLSPSLGVIYRF